VQETGQKNISILRFYLDFLSDLMLIFKEILYIFKRFYVDFLLDFLFF